MLPGAGMTNRATTISCKPERQKAGWVSPLKKMTECSQRLKTVTYNLSNRQHGHNRTHGAPHGPRPRSSTYPAVGPRAPKLDIL
jgi:hypothetical protein